MTRADTLRRCSFRAGPRSRAGGSIRPVSVETDPGWALYRAAIDPKSVEVSRRFVLRGPGPNTGYAFPHPRRGSAARRGSEKLDARVVEPAGGEAAANADFGSGLCLEFDLLSAGSRFGRQLAAMGWGVIEPISPYHGLRAMPGFYGGEPFFALGADRHARPDRGTDRRDGVADSLGAPALRLHGVGGWRLHVIVRGAADRKPRQSLSSPSDDERAGTFTKVRTAGSEPAIKSA